MVVADAGVARHIGERAVSVVAIQRLGSEAGDEEIEVAVVVVVADGDAHAVGAKADAGAFGDVREMERALTIRADRQIVPKKPTGLLACGRC